MDIYPVTKELQMGVFPINKNAAGTDNEDERGKNITLVAGQWNQVNIPSATSHHKDCRCSAHTS